MKPASGSVTLSVYAARLINIPNTTIEDILLQIKASTSSDPVSGSVYQDQKVVLISKLESHPFNDGVTAVFSFYEAGAERTSMVFNGRTEVEFQSTSAPSSGEWLDANVYMLAVKDTVIFAGLSKRSSSISRTICEVARKYKIISEIGQIAFFAMPSSDEMSKIRRYGVKRVEANVTPLIAASEDFNKAGYLERLLHPRTTAEAVRRRADYAVKISIHQTGLFKRKIGLAKEEHRDSWLDSIAESTIEDPNIQQFTIVLNNRDTIKSDSLQQTKTITAIKRNGVFPLSDIRDKMMEFFYEIDENRVRDG